MSNLENVLQCLSSLPGGTTKDLKHIKNLDHQIKGSNYVAIFLQKILDLKEGAEKMEKKFFKREKNRQYFLIKKKENKRLYSGIKSINKRIIKISKEKIETSNKIYEDVDKFIGNFLFFFVFL